MCGAPEPSRRTSNRIRWTSAGNALKLEGAGVAQTERYLYIQSKPRCYLFAMIAFGIIALANITTATAATIDVEAELGSNVHLQSSLNDDFDQGFRRMDGRNMIMNGLTVNEKQRKRYQFTASIKYGSSHLCGGTLIAPDIVLSAAHCFNQKFDIDMLQVTVGDVSARFVLLMSHVRCRMENEARVLFISHPFVPHGLICFREQLTNSFNPCNLIIRKVPFRK